MNRITVAVLPLLFSATTAFAQAPQSSIRESTDPARVAEVERRAQQMRSAQSAGGGQPQMQTQTQPRRPGDAERGPMQRDGMRGDGRSPGHAHGQAHGHGHGHRHGHGHGNPRMHHDHPKAAPNSGK